MTRKSREAPLIDDDPGIRNVLTISLEDAGYRVFTAPDGETGIRTCEAMGSRFA